MKYGNITPIIFALISVITTGLTHADDYGEGRANYSASIALDNAQGRHSHWRAVGRLQVSHTEQKSRCTASLIDSRDRNMDASGPAYILTSGHCVTRDSLNFSSDLPLEGHIDFDYFLGNTERTQRYALKKAVKATMRGADLAIIELDSTLQSLLDKGIEPLKISSDAPIKNMGLMIVGVPSGHEDAPALRLSLCRYEGAEDLVEEVYVFRAFYKHRCAGLAPGSSGSPLLDRQSNRIIGVVSTSTDHAKKENRCQTNAPCEIRNGQPAWSPDTQYSSPTKDLRICFSEGFFNPRDTDCILQSTLQMTLGDAYWPKTYSRIKLDDQGNVVLPAWLWPFSLDKPLYRYKTTRTPSECESPHHYSSALDATEGLIDDPVGPAPGMHLLCIIGVDYPSQPPAREMMNKPVVVAMELAPPGPTRMPELKIERLASGGYDVTPYYSSPSLWVYTFKSGTPAEVQCDDPQGYTPEFGTLKSIGAAQLPLKLCSKVYDMSRQPSLPRTDLLLP